MKRLLMAACLLMIASSASAHLGGGIVPAAPTAEDVVIYRYLLGDFCVPLSTHEVTISGYDIIIRESRVTAEGCRASGRRHRSRPMFFERDVPIGRLAPGTYTLRYYYKRPSDSDFLLAETIAFAVAPVPAIPTVSEVGLAAAVIVLALCGVVVLRR